MFLVLKIPTLPLHYFVSPRKKYTSQCNTFSKFQFIYGIKKGKFQLSSIHQKQFHMLLLRRDGVKNDDLIFCYQKPCTLHTKYILQCILIWMGWNLNSHSKYKKYFYTLLHHKYAWGKKMSFSENKASLNISSFKNVLNPYRIPCTSTTKLNDVTDVMSFLLLLWPMITGT